MGTRYVLELKCKKCGYVDNDVYFAPTCGFVTWECICGEVVDLYEHTGISYEEASNVGAINDIIKDFNGEEK
jgi:hypothetical protein